jgi:hypothetical protein
MLRPDQLKLLERYHDGEVTAQERAEVEALLARDTEALDFLGAMDESSSMLRVSFAQPAAAANFDGLWARLEPGLDAHDRALKAARAPAAVPTQGFLARVTAWLSEGFVAHKGAWVTAGATAFAVAGVMVGVHEFYGGGQTTKIIERQVVVVDSVDKIDPNSTVLVNHASDDGTTVIWTLPNTPALKNPAQDAPAEEPAQQDGVEIVEEPL